MNKQIKYMIILVVTAVFMMSCNGEFLERYPLTSVSDGGFWKSASDLRLYCNRFYNYVSSGNTQILFFPTYQDWEMGILGTDADDGSDMQVHYDYNTRMNGETIVPASGGGWAIANWSTLRSLNYFMANYNQTTEPWDNIKQYVGEILFFRAMFYFDKVKTFGDVPYASYLLFNDSEILYEPRLPRNQVVDSIMHDLDLAVEYLTARTGTWTGRVNKETAMLLQARIALYEGTWEKYHGLKSTPFAVAGSDGSKFIRKAADVSGALMALAESSGLTGLANVGVKDGYNQLFNQKDYSSNREVLFWRKYEVGVSFTRVASALATGGGRGMTKRLIDSYLCIDGKPISVSSLYEGDKDLKTVVTNRDPRLKQSMHIDDGEHVIWTQQNTFYRYPDFGSAELRYKSITGYDLYKGHDGDYDSREGPGISQINPSCGMIYFRYAEALLIYAEAKAELNEINQNDIDRTINALRLRAEMPDGLLNMSDIAWDSNWLYPNLSPLINEIRRERAVELACEGFRKDDIFRWAVADELIRGYIPQGAVWEQWRDYPNTTEAFVTAWSNLPVNDQGYIVPYMTFPAVATTGYNFNVNRDYLSPLPVQEMTLNSNLKQNPGW